MKTTKIEDMSEREINMFENLKGQVNAVFKHSHECAYKTRETYQERVEVFAKFLAVEYGKQNIKKITNEHLIHYVEYLQESNLSTSYVTTSMSAIRYFYKKAVGEKFKIKSNKALGVISRPKSERIGKDRAIKDGDYDELLEKTRGEGKKEYEYALKVGRTLGLRVHEFYKMRNSQIREAINNGEIKVKGKGGLIRVIPLGSAEISLLKEVLNECKSDNDRIFVQKNEKTHSKIKSLEDYIRNSRNELGKDYTYHSLRHAYAQKLYKSLMNQGMLEHEARMILIFRIGHSRKEVSDIYLSAVE